MNTPQRTYFIFFSLVILWCGMIVAAPLLQGVSEAASATVYKFYSRICHQLDDRSFHLAGGKFAVCIRCCAIYFTFFTGLLLFPLVRGLRNRKIPLLHWLCLSSLPMLLDVLLSVSGIHQSTDLTRFVTGSLFGFALPWYILPVLFESVAALFAPSHGTSKGAPLYARKTE